MSLLSKNNVWKHCQADTSNVQIATQERWMDEYMTEYTIP